jgi:hypothetical protein
VDTSKVSLNDVLNIIQEFSKKRNVLKWKTYEAFKDTANWMNDINYCSNFRDTLNKCELEIYNHSLQKKMDEFWKPALPGVSFGPILMEPPFLIKEPV